MGWKRAMPIVLGLLLILGLTSCGGSKMPSQGIVEQAVEQTALEVQQTLGRQLKTSPSGDTTVRVSRVRVERRQSLKIDEYPGAYVEGRYNLKLSLPDRTLRQQNNPFSLYLQWSGQETGWQLARPQTATDSDRILWRTYPLRATPSPSGDAELSASSGP